MPTAAFIVDETVPVTEDDTSPLPEGRLLFDWSVGFHFSVNLLVRRVAGSGGRFTQWGASASTGRELNDWMGFYVELILLTPRVLNGQDTGKVGGGFLFFVSERMQLDVRTELGLYGGSPDFAIGGGAAVMVF